MSEYTNLPPATTSEHSRSYENEEDRFDDSAIGFEDYTWLNYNGFVSRNEY